MANTEKYEVTIETDGKGIDVRLLNDFLYHFRAAYAAGVLNAQQFDSYPPRTSYDGLSSWLQSIVNGGDWKAISRLAYVDLREGNLEIVDIRRENPLIIVFYAIPVALTIAAIISGGEVEVGPRKFKVKLPPLGTGIASLRQAFKRPPKHDGE